MTKINDGGTAFPVAVDGIAYSTGMSMRDWFAGNQTVPSQLSVEYAEALCGRQHPHKTIGALGSDEILQVLAFWADAEARYRYIFADAMLAARDGSASV
ncbi:hypothetical protein IFT84_17650 [Rhizobium sp. CFBP 8762]|uniref:hypothetical protein n=1 Tax=Rhizobium sp. CFBP 8762 TaxID=2775279 RepID=UPI001781424F|nr:hypothetical protein [Rhizobium sp. CFBP 8762]MBD8556336.1 hypothetical protein [Rhizobium sp. CFBP 8762]